MGVFKAVAGVLAGSEARRVKLIFNPHSGAAVRLHLRVEDVLAELVSMDFLPDACIVEPGGNLAEDVRKALALGFRLFVVCGGDGTVSTVAGEVAGARAALAIIPAGSQNNLALSLGIPQEMKEAAGLLKKGRRLNVDVGRAHCRGGAQLFLETCSVGLISALSPSGESIQHGDLSGVGEFLGKLISAEAADMELLLDGRRLVRGRGHIALVANTPYIGFHYRSGSPLACQDGKLDVLFFEGLSKLELLAFAARGMHIGKPDDPRIQRLSAQSIEIRTLPPMPVMADGKALGHYPVKIDVMKQALSVFVPKRPMGRK